MKAKKITTIAMFCAVAFLASLIKLPFNGFLELELKSAVITICAFMMGPAAGFIISLIVPFIEMLTVSLRAYRDADEYYSYLCFCMPGRIHL
jgi:riboflavin transporter FmnP